MRERRPLPSLSALVVAGAALYAGYRLRAALAPFVLAAAFAYVLNPAVAYFEGKGLRRAHLVVLGYVAALGLGAWASAGIKAVVVGEIDSLTVNAPTYVGKLQGLAAREESLLTGRLPVPPEVAQRAIGSAVDAGLARVQALPSQILGLVPLLLHALLVPFIGFFFLLDGPGGFDRLIQALPSRYVEQALHLAGEIDRSLGNYVRGLVIAAVVVGAVSFVGLVLLGVDNALAIAALAGATSFLPGLGAVVGAAAGGAMAVYQFGSLWAGAKVLILFGAIKLADDAFLEPLISKRAVHLHVTVYLLALIVGGEMFGFLGLVFAIPAACVLKALFGVVWAWYASETGLAAPFASEAEAVPYV
ncbi:MAG: AI-2E family transporter [Elusimicrobia bacterium]|nr:AI-2E family transporter [Elusimicrobiota bacterium]